MPGVRQLKAKYLHDLHGLMKAPLPENETNRLAVLRQFGILDTLPEEGFDDITFVASQICGTPITLVSLIDQDRQWFKSKRGLDISETSRDVSFCAHALLNPNELLIVPDTREDERFADNPFVTGGPHVQFYAGAPLALPSGEVLGTLCVIDNKPRELTEDQQKGLRALARQVMVQMELRRHLIEFADHMAVQVQVEAALRESEERFRAFMDNSPIVAFLKNEQGRYTYVNRPFLQRFNLELDHVIGQDDFALWPDAAPELREHDLSVLTGDGTVSIIETVPIPGGDEHYWQVYKFPLQRGGGTGRFLAGVALDITQNKRYEKQLEEYQQKLEEAFSKVEAQSLTDVLTGLNNRRALERKFEEEFKRAQRYQLPFSVLIMDVDHFKSFNDNFGHPAGDELLHNLGQLLAAKARTSDFVARYGGEEFVVLLPNTNSEGAFKLAERFRLAVEAMPCSHRSITISVGVASFNAGMDNSATLLAAADKALYEAKGNGRNRVVQAQ
ncbi:phytochrome-like protein cph2 [Abditibacteriota bacterium]|nr:phytochrome-like protein cph2 [Abditibacteriota bacterium]